MYSEIKGAQWKEVLDRLDPVNKVLSVADQTLKRYKEEYQPDIEAGERLWLEASFQDVEGEKFVMEKELGGDSYVRVIARPIEESHLHGGPAGGMEMLKRMNEVISAGENDMNAMVDEIAAYQGHQQEKLDYDIPFIVELDQGGQRLGFGCQSHKNNEITIQTIRCAGLDADRNEKEGENFDINFGLLDELSTPWQISLQSYFYKVLGLPSPTYDAIQVLSKRGFVEKQMKWLDQLVKTVMHVQMDTESKK